ncbi:hypothetical protein FACS1894188_03820 [Clostridia bacterium]|nr:hypothetical protein FACS1894188_03820 [Clostridia bacterium]
MQTEPLELLTIRYEKNENGVQEEQDIEPSDKRTVFADVNFVGMNEHYAAKRDGVQAVYRVTIYEMEYRGERYCNLRGKRYRIERAANAGQYKSGRGAQTDKMELVLSEADYD